MVAWKHDASTAYNCLESISHLLKGKHSSNPRLLENSASLQNLGQNLGRNADGNVALAMGDVSHGSTENSDMEQPPRVPTQESISVTQIRCFLTGNWNGSADPDQTIGSDSSDSFHSCASRFDDNRAVDSLQRLSILGEEEQGGYPEWFDLALRGESNLLSFTENPRIARPGCSFSPPAILPIVRAGIPEPILPIRPPSPYRFINDPLRREDPISFHLDPFDSPPPSPSQEEADFEMNMQVDPNGMIPELPANYVESPLLPTPPLDLLDRILCPLEYCHSFNDFLITTVENVKDKKSVLKEMFHHTSRLLKSAAEIAPARNIEAIIDLAASVALIANSFGTSDDLESFQRFATTAQDLVCTIQDALIKQMRS